MAKRGPDEAFLLVGGYDLGQDSHSLNYSKTATLEETTAFGDTFVENSYVGIVRGTVTQEGYYDDADNRSSEALAAKSGTSRAMVVALAGNAQGRLCAGISGAMQSTFGRGANRNELTKVSATFESNGAIEEGVILQSLAAESGAGATSDGSYDHGAAATRSAAYLQVTELALGGYTSITVKVQESSDDGAGDAWADIATFTVVTAESVGERIAIATSVERYTRVTLTLNGSGSSESITMLVAITD
jgi:hypothetical protein